MHSASKNRLFLLMVLYVLSIQMPPPLLPPHPLRLVTKGKAPPPLPLQVSTCDCLVCGGTCCGAGTGGLDDYHYSVRVLAIPIVGN